MNRREALQSLLLQVEEVSKNLKTLALQREIPVLALPMVGQVEVARLKPTDTLVLTVAKPSSPCWPCRWWDRAPGRISEKQAARLEHVLKRAFPDHRVLVMDNGLSLKVVSTGTT